MEDRRAASASRHRQSGEGLDRRAVTREARTSLERSVTASTRTATIERVAASCAAARPSDTRAARTCARCECGALRELVAHDRATCRATAPETLPCAGRAPKDTHAIAASRIPAALERRQVHLREVEHPLDGHLRLAADLRIDVDLVAARLRASRAGCAGRSSPSTGNARSSGTSHPCRRWAPR